MLNFGNRWKNSLQIGPYNIPLCTLPFLNQSDNFLVRYQWPVTKSSSSSQSLRPGHDFGEVVELCLQATGITVTTWSHLTSGAINHRRPQARHRDSQFLYHFCENKAHHRLVASSVGMKGPLTYKIAVTRGQELQKFQSFRGWL